MKNHKMCANACGNCESKMKAHKKCGTAMKCACECKKAKHVKKHRKAKNAKKVEAPKVEAPKVEEVKK